MGASKVTLMCCVLLLISCGGSDFMPKQGPFSGEFVNGGEVIGSFTFTVTDGLVGGTGMLTHNSEQITVSISGVISDKSITGQVEGGSEGAGMFTGRFTNEEASLGSFDFLGTDDQQTTSGTWIAVIN
jgi:hypothetical protein